MNTTIARIGRWLLLLLTVTTIGCGAGAAARKDEDYYTSGSKEADQRAEQTMARDAQLKGGQEDGTSLGAKLGGNPELTGPAGVPKADEKKTLYDRLGGETGIAKITDDFVTRVLADPQVNLERKGVKHGGLSFKRGVSMEWKAEGDNLAKLKLYLNQFMSLKTGGPPKYEGPDLKTITKDLHFANAEFDAAIGDLKQALETLQIPNQEQKELLAIVESTRPQIAEDR